jgi:hypothetical protein
MTSTSVPTSLFSPGARPDNGPPPYAWRGYRVLDRCRFERSAEVRRELDDWFSRLPPKAAAQIAERFRDRDDSVHLGAFLELYLHEAGKRLGAEVDIDVGNDEADERRPDFLLRWGDLEVYAEATAIAGADVHDPRAKLQLDELCDALDTISAPRFLLAVKELSTGKATPPFRRFVAETQRWLDGLDPDVVRADAGRDSDGPGPTTVVGFDGWALHLEALTTRDDGYADPHHRVVGSRFSGFSKLNDLGPLRRKVKKKAGRYGLLGKPYVLVALAAGSFVDDRDVEHALLGPIGYHYDLAQQRLVGGRERDGAWMRESGPVNTRLSGVLTLVNLSPGAVCAVEPTYWPNPWAQYPLPDPGPWRRIEAQRTGQTVEHDRTSSVADIFGLPDRWPVVARHAAP